LQAVDDEALDFFVDDDRLLPHRFINLLGLGDGFFGGPGRTDNLDNGGKVRRIDGMPDQATSATFQRLREKTCADRGCR
jgi:hypothetical protein